MVRGAAANSIQATEACEWNSRCVIPMSRGMQDPHFGAAAGGEAPALRDVTRRAELAKLHNCLA